MSLARPAPRRRRSSFNRFARMAAAMAVAVALAACTRDEPGWHLTNVTGHLPDLSFTLTGGDGRPVDASAFRGRVALVYFGYTHCPDVCPETMARLMEVLAKLGPRANDVRILFVSVDPARDTPQALQSYVAAFDAAHARGLTGSDGQIESLAKRYRVAYQMEQRDPSGGYEVTHSSAVYIFDAHGRARLLATDGDSPDAIAADVRRIIDTAPTT
ncbi:MULTISPECIES: SCO family protein [Burkholderia]|uniref:SCO family protein n=1 Tax=Burkholderia vietnamiensis TaxID=60552 RepID=A0A132DEK6_BURVI|nr:MULTISPECIES: SCO family protein [Burkholderia]AFJ85420.1 Cytochrome oxidase biogenesis protein Sco1/SenC/PrrC, Putative copper metallochaperone [Burkholderia sp. KJ006]AOK09670.1 photosynthetic protein synthase I [Burkholderia vietnamiensis]AOK40485.1 photosynthetic protein synthase I [Burkholderia vietnamiensis]KKI40846.1 photosynthetic protein synthase I [Burkholderia vietnamiensis]KVE64031.1 photosynthetic protein synthase I [Burkholderia vietnamiensis]